MSKGWVYFVWSMLTSVCESFGVMPNDIMEQFKGYCMILRVVVFFMLCCADTSLMPDSRWIIRGLVQMYKEKYS